MARFQLHTIETAPAASRPVLQAGGGASPELPCDLDLWAAMAESALTLDAYMGLRQAVERRATLDTRVRSAVALAAGAAIGGRYSPDVNTRIARRAGWSPGEIEHLRRDDDAA